MPATRVKQTIRIHGKLGMPVGHRSWSKAEGWVKCAKCARHLIGGQDGREVAASNVVPQAKSLKPR
jgi:hypothetical protein